MAQYCPSCSNKKLAPVEMGSYWLGSTINDLSLPTCSQQREEIGKWFGGTEVRNVSTEQANKTIRKANLAMAGLALGVDILGAIVESKKKP